MTIGLLLIGLCGCIKVKDELTINADGSGKVEIQTDTSMPPEFAGNMTGRANGLGGGAIYPPTSEAEAHQFFPAKDFTITVKQQKAASGDGMTVVIEASFKDINALLSSPYGRAHQLTARIEGSSLVVRGISGMETVARFAEMKDDSGMGMGMYGGLADLQKNTNEMRDEFRVTLPNALSMSTGTKDAKTADWTVERAKCKDAADFATQLSIVCEARCPADGLKMTPVTLVRIGLLPFAELAAGVTDTGSAVDTNKIISAAKFVPYGISVTRSLDLTGEGGGQQNSAQLMGAVVVPPEFQPQKWADPKLDEAVDAKGNDLKPGDSDQNRFLARAYSSRTDGADDDDDSASNSIPKHVITVNFRPPDWKVNEIARIKGSVGMQYFGGSQVVKLTNAVPASWIMDVSKMAGGGGFNSGEKPLTSDALSSLGLTLSVQTAMAQSGMTMIMLQVTGKTAALTDAQVFDANGKPWPTILQQQNIGMGDNDSCQIMVAGKPQPPLSLAFMASGSGTTVEIPFLLEHVSFSK